MHLFSGLSLLRPFVNFKNNIINMAGGITILSLNYLVCPALKQILMKLTRLSSKIVVGLPLATSFRLALMVDARRLRLRAGQLDTELNSEIRLWVGLLEQPRGGCLETFRQPSCSPIQKEFSFVQDDQYGGKYCTHYGLPGKVVSENHITMNTPTSLVGNMS